MVRIGMGPRYHRPQGVMKGVPGNRSPTPGSSLYKYKIADVAWFWVDTATWAVHRQLR